MAATYGCGSTVTRQHTIGHHQEERELTGTRFECGRRQGDREAQRRILDEDACLAQQAKTRVAFPDIDRNPRGQDLQRRRLGASFLAAPDFFQHGGGAHGHLRIGIVSGGLELIPGGGSDAEQHLEGLLSFPVCGVSELFDPSRRLV